MKAVDYRNLVVHRKTVDHRQLVNHREIEIIEIIEIIEVREKALPGLVPIELIRHCQYYAALRSNVSVCSAAHTSTGQP